MNSELDARWRNAVMPFNGEVLLLESAEDLTLDQLQAALNVIVEDLHTHWKHAELGKITDWHEKDGYIESAMTTHWGEVREWLATTETLRAASPSEEYVQRGLYPLSFEWFLRFTVDEDDPDDSYCSLDLSGSADLLNRVGRKLTDELSLACQRQPARDYFDRISAG